MWQADDQGTLRQRMLGQSQNQMPDMMAQMDNLFVPAGSPPPVPMQLPVRAGDPPPQMQLLTDQTPVDTSLKDQMLGQIMQDNPRDKYSKKGKGGDSGMMGSLLKMAMSMFGGGG